MGTKVSGARAGRTGRVVAALAVVTAVGLTSCSARSSSSDTASAPAATAAEGDTNRLAAGKATVNNVPGAPAAGGNGSGAGDAASGASFKVDALDPTAAPVGSFISTATMTVEVQSVNDAKPKVIAAAIAAGGGLFGEQTTLGDRARSVITLKVPPTQFAKLLGDLAQLGALASQEVKTDDVTQQVVDLGARLKASESSLERTQLLLGQAKSLTEISALENEVARRQADVESLRGQQKTLDNRVNLATIVVTLSGEKDATAAVEEKRRQDELDRQQREAKPLPGFGDGLDGGLKVARTIGTVTLAGVGAALPFLPLVILLVFAVRVARRAQRKRPT